MSKKRYTVKNEKRIIDPEGFEVFVVVPVDGEPACAVLNDLLDRAEKAEADCKAMAAALAALPRATVVASDGTVNLCYGVVVGPDALEAVRRWRP